MQWLRKTTQNRARWSRKAIRGRQALIHSFEARLLMSASYVLNDLAAFDDTTGNEANAAMIMDTHGNFFGTTPSGGANGLGTVYEMAAGSGVITTIASFTTSTGYNTQASLVMDSNGDLLGTTPHGGQHNDGSVFKIMAGSSTITLVASFNSGNADSSGPLTLDAQGNLYGTTYKGGTGGYGTVFKIANGSSSITTLCSFNTSSGKYPTSGVIRDAAGNLYGTTSSGGTNGAGILFELPSGGSSPTTLASLPANSGSDQTAPLVRDSNGDLFGTTILGGANSDGSIYELPAGGSTITTLASMDSTTGINPSAGLILDANGNLFGTTTSDGPDGFGTVYELATGSSTITVLSSFDGDNASPGTNQLGTYPIIPSLNMDAQGNLYGVAGEGGTNNLGAIFEVSQVHATHAVVTTQPTTAIAETTQTIGVSLESDAGLVDSSLNVPVTLSITSGPTGGILGGTPTISAVAGVATFSDLTFNFAGTYTLTASSASLASGTTTTITVTAAAANQLVVAQQPSTTIAGQTIPTVAIDVEDVFGNLVTTDDSTLTISTSNNTFLSGTTAVVASGGVATFTDLAITQVGVYTLSATDGSLISGTTIPFSIVPATAKQLVIAQQPSNSIAGQPFGRVIVDVEDAFGNLVTVDSSTVSLSTTDGTPLSGTDAVSAVSGVATFSTASMNHAGTYTLSATDNGRTSATTNSFAVSPAAAAKLVVGQQPTTAVAGQTLGNFAVEVEDAYGNLAITDQSSVTIAGTALTGTRITTAVNGVAVFNNLSINTAGIYALTVTDAALTSASTAAITVAKAIPVVIAGNKLAAMVITPSTAFAASTVPAKWLMMQVKNQAGSILLTRKISAKRNRATVANVKMSLVGNYTMVISNPQGQAMTQAFKVIAAAPAKMAFTSATTVADATATLSVYVLDRFGNLCVARDGATVTLRLSSGKHLTLSGALSATVTNGVAVFSNVSVNQSGRARLMASSAKLASAKTYLFEDA